MDDFVGRFRSSVACSTPFSYSNYTRFKCYEHRRHLRSSFDMSSVNMLFKRLNDRLTVKQAIFRIMIIKVRKDK